MPKLQKQQKEELMNGIIRLILQIQKENPGQRLKISNIVEKSGLSNNFIYHNFGNRDGLILATAEHLHDQLMSRMDAIADESVEDAIVWSEGAWDILQLSHDAGRHFYNYSLISSMRVGGHAQECVSIFRRKAADFLSKQENRNCSYSADQLGHFYWCMIMGACLCASCDNHFEQLDKERLQKAYEYLGRGYLIGLGKAGEEEPFPGYPLPVWGAAYSEKLELQQGKVREQLRAVLRKSGKDISFWNITISQLLEIVHLNPSEFYEDYTSLQDVLDDTATCIWSEILEYGRMVFPDTSSRSRIAEHFGIAVTIMRTWGTSLSFCAVLSDRNFVKNTHVVPQSIARIAEKMLDQKKLEALGTDIASISYAFWNVWIGTCMMIVGDKDFNMEELKTFTDLISLFAASGFGYLQQECEKR